jgi:hypothetical protein
MLDVGETAVDLLGQNEAVSWDFEFNHWIGLRENLQETIVFTIKYRAFL